MKCKDQNINNVAVTVLSFHFYPSSGAQDSSVKLWDLRKLKNFKTISLDNNYEVKTASISLV